MTATLLQTDLGRSTLDQWAECLRCPHCRTRLEVGGQGDGFRCPTCRGVYPVTAGVVRFLDRQRPDGAEQAIKQKEIAARDSSAERYDAAINQLRNALEIPPCVAAVEPRASDVVAELGCGTGRITLQYASRVRRVVAVDFSLQSLLVLGRRIPDELRDRVLLVQADISAPPLPPGAFTKVVSFQVFEHLPTAESRQQAVSAAAGLLAPGGTLTCSVYNWSRSKQLAAVRGLGDDTRKEGFHSSGIYYYNFEEPEFRELLRNAGLHVELLRGLIIPVRGATVLGPLVVPLNRLLSRTSFGVRRSHLLLARGRADNQSPS